MSFDISVTHEAGRTRVLVQGDARMGRLLSLLQVLELDSASWPHDAVLLDLRQLQGPISPAEQERLAAEATQRLRRQVTVLAA